MFQSHVKQRVLNLVPPDFDFVFSHARIIAAILACSFTYDVSRLVANVSYLDLSGVVICRFCINRLAIRKSHCLHMKPNALYLKSLSSLPINGSTVI